MEAPPKVHRHHRHRRINSRRHIEENIVCDRRPLANQTETVTERREFEIQIPLESTTSVNNRNNQNLDQPSLLVNGHEPRGEENVRQKKIIIDEVELIGQGLCSEKIPETLAKTKRDERHLHRGILGFMDRDLKASTGNGKKLQSFSDPQASPAQRSTHSRSSLDKSPRRKRSKSESRRRRERKLIAAGEMEVRQANETLMRYLKQCSEMNDASLSGELEIDHSFEERRVHRRTKSQRDKKGHLLNRNTGGPLASILKDLSEDIVPMGGEIYNPFTPVVSPTEGPPSRIDKMFIQTSTGYRAVDHCFFKNPIESDPESNKIDIVTSVNLSCALQRIWIMVSNICHGLLGGLALAHLLFIATSHPYDWATGTIRHYSSFAEMYANTFYCLTIVCMVSIFDRMDICRIDVTSAQEIISFRWIIITMIYIATIILTLCAESVDEKLYLSNFNTTLLETEMEINQIINVWNSLSIARSIGAIIGWIMIGLSSSDDLLYGHLIEMEKYQLTNN